MTQVVLITGASVGIGKATAERLAQAGFRVFGTSRTLRPITNGVTFLSLDVTQPHSIETCVKEVLAQAGRIDILINNAGLMGVAGGPDEISDEQWQRVLDTNLMGTVRMVRAVVPHMRARRHGLIINISSLAGIVGAPYFFGPYIASKHAIEGYTESLRAEVKSFGVRAALIELSYTKTEIGLSLEEPAMPVEDYKVHRQRAYAMEQYAVEKGRNPEIIAEAIERLIHHPNPPLRTPAGYEAALFLPIVRPTPHRAIEMFFGWLLDRDEDWAPDYEPLRRMFMDTEFSDAVQKRSLVALLAVAPILILGWLWRRTK